MLLFLGILKWLSLGLSVFFFGFVIFNVFDNKKTEDSFLEEYFSEFFWSRNGFAEWFYWLKTLLAILFLVAFIFLANFIPKYKAEFFSDSAVFERIALQDREGLESLGSQKLALQEALSRINEPSYYIIAPMTYDTKKFVEDNSHDKSLFGGEKNNSAERLTILESCITDFTHKVDEITGVSFLDRTKIAQIEKEHKFQLGDWSNDKKTAEIGKALNANIMLFLDKFGFIDSGSGEYRFEAKFVDINTMQSASYNIVYKNPKKKVITPEIVKNISFRDFTAISTKNHSFEDELPLKTKTALRTVQRSDLKATCPLGSVVKLELSDYDTLAPKSKMLQVSSISIDGFGSVELKSGGETTTGTYTFEPCEMYFERIGNDFYTDGKIGTLSVQTQEIYEKFDVFTTNNREYFLKVGTAELPKVTVNYYLQLVRN